MIDSAQGRPLRPGTGDPVDITDVELPEGATRLPHLTAPDDGLPLHFRRVVSFHPRGGRLNPVQRKAWDTHAEAWNVDPTLGLPNLKTLFGRNAPLIIEIGSGMGEATAGMAANRPEANILAIEVYKPGVAQTFHHLGKAGVDNVRLMRGDAIEVLEALIPSAAVAEIWLFFPDPWPKARHLKRRLVTPSFATLVASRLKKGGVLRLGTDWEPYAEQMLAVCTNEPKLKNRHTGWAPRPDFRPRTRFERRGLTAGREIFDLEFVRR
ncbi:MAG: tRNA (guanosine(46)-N7)-methyltransferase TrmB [Nakamurella sp.]